MKKVDSKVVIAKAKKKESNRAKVSFTFDSELYGKFEQACTDEKVFASRALEELIRLFLEDRESNKKS